MSRVRQPQTAFSSGEVSPLLYGRNDYQRFQTGLRSARGFMPIREGGFTRAPGTIFRGFTKGNGKARLIPFQFSEQDALTLEFTNGLMRVWRYGKLVEMTDAAGTIFEMVTPYDEGALDRLQAVQSADVIYLVDGKRPIQKLSRFALDNWTIADLELKTGPFRVQNLDKDKTVTALGATGNITLSASHPIFDAKDVGSLMQLSPSDYSSISLWIGNAVLDSGTLLRYAGNIYRLISDGGAATQNTGATPPIHDEGIQTTDADKKASYAFVSGDTGTVRITAFNTAQSVAAEVIKTIPSPCVFVPTYRWSEGAWSEKYGYPLAIEIWGQSLYAAATPSEPRTFWASTLGDFSDFEPSTEADGSFAFTISGTTTQNGIRWLKAGRKGIYIGALGEVYRGFTTTKGQRAGPTTFDIEIEGPGGASNARPILPYSYPVYPTKDGSRMVELRFSFEEDGGSELELSAPSSHLGAEGFAEIVWQSSPQRLAYIRRGNGDIAVMLYDPKESVLGWSVIPLAGGFVESMAVVAGANGANDILTLVVRREIDGATVRMIEEQALFYGILTGTRPISEAVHFFAASVFTPDTPTDTFNIGHLVGQQVYAWTDQGDYGPITVPLGGEITLPNTVNRATIGLFDETHFAETLDIQALAKDGDPRGRPERLYAGGAAILHKTTAGFVNAIERNFGEAVRDNGQQHLVALSVATDLTKEFSGTVSLDTPTGHASEQTLRFTPHNGAPMTILAIIPTIGEVGPIMCVPALIAALGGTATAAATVTGATAGAALLNVGTVLAIGGSVLTGIQGYQAAKQTRADIAEQKKDRSTIDGG